MAEALSRLALALVVALLAAGVWRQFVRLGQRGRLLDMLAIVPQWRFFAQARVAADEGCFDDLHLVARTRQPDETAGDWQELLWWDERRWLQALWNPQRRVRETLAEAMATLCLALNDGIGRPRTTALAYLTVLRFAIDRLALPEGAVLQFAVVTSRGREDRPVAVDFLSEWHSR